MAETKITQNEIQPYQWVTANYVAGWSDYDAVEWFGARYCKDAVGVVRLKGLARNSSGSTKSGSSTILVLPVGHRPLFSLRFPVAAAATASPNITWVTVLPGGEVISDSAIPNTEWVSLASVQFLAEA